MFAYLFSFRHIAQYGDKEYPHFVHDSLIPVIPEDQKLITDQDKEFWEQTYADERAVRRLKVIKSAVDLDAPGRVTSKAVILPKTQLGIGAFPCHLCTKSYEKKITLEKHLEGNLFAQKFGNLKKFT